MSLTNKIVCRRDMDQLSVREDDALRVAAWLIEQSIPFRYFPSKVYVIFMVPLTASQKLRAYADTLRMVGFHR